MQEPTGNDRKICKNCKHWKNKWYNEDRDETCGYGCHTLERNGEFVSVDVGVCILSGKKLYITKLEDDPACDRFEEKEISEVEGILLG